MLQKYTVYGRMIRRLEIQLKEGKSVWLQDLHYQDPPALSGPEVAILPEANVKTTR